MTDSASPYRRVMVIGSPGGGKTELGMALAEWLDLPFVDLDDEHWGSRWTEPPREVWHARMDELVAEPAWVMAGNFGGTIDVRARRADLVILIDLPPLTCVWRLVLRSLKTRLGRQIWRLPRECRAGPDWEPWREYPEFLRYTWRFRRQSFPREIERLRSANVDRIVHLRTTDEARRLERELESVDDPSAALAAWLEPLPADAT